MTSGDDMELVHGSGNLFRDLGRPNPEARQLKAILAAQVLKVLDDHGLSTRKAQELTGIDHGDFSRVRRAKLDRFTVERLIAMLEGLGQEVEVSVDVRPRQVPTAPSKPPAAALL
jgi:predicted XRE-type DNA-binding protein